MKVVYAQHNNTNNSLNYCQKDSHFASKMHYGHTLNTIASQVFYFIKENNLLDMNSSTEGVSLYTNVLY